ncbi:MAG TPA: iron ABC transporter permease [Blastocatellia bacterium]|nr:iron ABC transporter permease [Blastocatellia bacterium]
MLGGSFLDSADNFSLKNYGRLIVEPRQRSLLFNSMVLGAGSTIVATALGAPLGLLLARVDLPIKRLLRIVLIAPLVIPPYILALAWIYIGGSAGLIAQVSGYDALSSWTYSLPGAVVVLGLGFYPLSMLATEAAARRVDGRLEEAGLLVAGMSRVVRRITLPLITPSVAAAALIIFILAISEFGVPGLLRVPVFTTEVFTTFSALYDFGAATALAAPLVLLALMTGIMVKLITGERLLTTRRSSHPGLPINAGRWQAPMLGWMALVIATAVISPLTVLVVEAGRMDRVVSAIRASGSPIINSILFAALGATLIVGLSVLLGYWRNRIKSSFRNLLDFSFILIFAVPGTVIGVGLISLWNRPGLPGQVYTSSAIIIIAYLARFVPIAALILAASIRQVPASFEEAAEVSGAGWLRTFARIILPQIQSGLAAAWVISFILAFGELGVVVLVAPPGKDTLPVHVYTMIANAPSSHVATLALMQAGIVLLPLIILGSLSRIRESKR